MTDIQKQAYEWAINQNYQSVAARYAKILAELVAELVKREESGEGQETNELKRKRLLFLDEIIESLPNEMKNCETKCCKNCGNLGTTLIPLGIYWAERRCHYCNDYDSWSSILETRRWIAEQRVHP